MALLRTRVKAAWQEKVFQEPEWASEDEILTYPRSTVAWGFAKRDGDSRVLYRKVLVGRQISNAKMLELVQFYALVQNSPQVEMKRGTSDLPFSLG